MRSVMVESGGNVPLGAAGGSAENAHAAIRTELESCHPCRAAATIKNGGRRRSSAQFGSAAICSSLGPHSST